MRVTFGSAFTGLSSGRGVFANVPSSRPLSFNRFGALALDLNLATAVFRRLLPEFVHGVQHIAFEHSPSRRNGPPKGSEVGEPPAVSKIQVDPRSRYVIRVRLRAAIRKVARAMRSMAFHAHAGATLYMFTSMTPIPTTGRWFAIQ